MRRGVVYLVRRIGGGVARRALAPWGLVLLPVTAVVAAPPATVGVTTALPAPPATVGVTTALASVPPGNVIRVKGVAGDTVVALVASDAGGLVPVHVLARLLGGSVDSTDRGVWRLAVHSAALELHEGSPFAGYSGFIIPLLEPVRRIDGQLHAPLQVFSEILPRFGIGVIWDRTRWEVRVFESIARRSTSAAASTVGGTTVTPVSVGTATKSPAVPAVAASANIPAPPKALETDRRAAAPTALTKRYVVAVDAGHGGKDPGNPGVVVGGERLNEAKLTLQMALKLEQALQARGIDVVMTRKRDTLIALHERGPIANARKADLFVSLHTNAANPSWRNGSAVRGVETYFLSTARTEDERRVAAMENEAVRYETETPASSGDPLAFILSDLVQNEHLRESSDLAEVVQRRLARQHPGPNRGVKQGSFSVLTRSFMPAILVEVGFGTNPDDARWMASAEGQRDIAASIADAVVEYLQHYERRTGRGGG